ncbi:MAG: hypothetical protein ACI8TX_000873 [Hyphomicrobiaceae bacterium]|jgi:hypothetical protein
MTRTPKAYARFTKFIAEEMERNSGVETAEVYVDLQRQLNARPFRPVLDATRDLGRVVDSNSGTPDFILPLETHIGARQRPKKRPPLTPPVASNSAKQQHNKERPAALSFGQALRAFNPTILQVSVTA